MIRRSIGARLAAAYLVPTLLGLAALGFYVNQLARRALEEELGRKVSAIAMAAAATIPADRLAWLQQGDEGSRTYGHLQQRLEELRSATGLRRLALFTQAETALVDVGGTARIGDPLPELARDRLELEAVFAGTPQASQVLFELDGQLFKTGYAPIRHEGKVVAAVLAEGSAESFAVLREFRASLLALGILAALCIVLVAFLFSRTLVAPIRRLVAAARGIGGGDLATPVQVRGADELAYLGRTLDEMRERLLARDRQLQLMLAGIAHEVRNPLGGMELYSGLLLEELEGDEPKARQVRKIRREIGQLSRLVNDFLDFARERPLAVQEIDARSLADEAAGLLAAEALTRGVTLEVKGPRLPLRCDPDLVKRALLNLLHNAVQAAPAGSTVEVSISEEDGRCSFAVIDRGAGVRPDAEGRIFEPFFTTREKGTGLGLAFVQRIADAHGGSIRHRQTPGGGATFDLSLPRAGPAVDRRAGAA